MISDNDRISEQEAKFELRESFLQALINLKGTPCKILTYEQSTLEATFAEWNPDGSEMLVTDLKTPANIKMTSALLRMPDIISVHFNNTVPIQ